MFCTPVLQLLKEDLKPPQQSIADKLSVKESQLLYAGYLFVTFSERKVMQSTDVIEFLKAFSKRAIVSQMPSCVKSFILPIAYHFTVEPNPHKLLTIFDDVPELLWKWITYTPKFSDDASKLSYLGLLGVLRATRLDIKLAGLKIKRGGEYAQNPQETILLQTKLVHAFSEFLQYMVPRAAAPAQADDFGDDYGGMYGDYDDEMDDDDAFNKVLDSAKQDMGFNMDDFVTD